MNSWIPELSISWSTVFWSFALFIITFSISLALTAWLFVLLPVDYFVDSATRSAWRSNRHPITRAGIVIGKNVLGIALVLLGIVLSLPGVPGQGVLTILLGVMLVDFPGRRRFEIWLVSRPRVYNGINRLRRRFEKPPLLLEQRPPP